MRGYDDPRPTRTRRPGRWLALLTIAVILAGCGGGGGVAAPTGDGGTTAGGSATGGGTSGGGTSGGGTSGGSTNGGEPPVGIDLGGPSLGTPGPPGGPSFGEVAVGSRSAPQRFELRNPLEFGFTVMGLTVEGGDGSFALTEDHCSGVSLPARTGTCTFALEFAPRHEGVASGGLIARMTHTCTALTYRPCDQDPQWGQGQGKNFTRVDGPNGEVTFVWTNSARLTGTGTAA